ncbi:MAG: nuclear transport factor 2 family protein [Longimicrobiales bacterium]|nr:nuclear transport factor 2 family protein [Longimicrobiales bacterium]
MRMAIVFVALVLGACAPRPSGPSRLETENEIAIRALLGLVGSGSAEDVAGLFHPDAVYDDFANQQQYRGMEEIAGYVSGGSRWATAVSVDVIEVHVSSTGAVAEWVFTGIQDHPIGSLLPVVTGREVVLNGVTIIEMEDGRIRRAADYVDGLPLVLQLGGEVHMPGGGILKQDPADPPLSSDTLPIPQEP